MSCLLGEVRRLAHTLSAKQAADMRCLIAFYAPKPPVWLSIGHIRDRRDLKIAANPHANVFIEAHRN